MQRHRTKRADLGACALTLTDREVGELHARLRQIEHARRNDKTILLALDEEVTTLRRDMEKLRARIYATISSVMVFAALVAWVVDVMIV
jgi:hypothetical protein